jgi:hypothetical protein
LPDVAERLFGPVALETSARFAGAVAIATIDEVLQHAVRDCHVHTVADVGAGLDTRPYRLALPSDLRWIEGDLETVLGYKELRLAHASPRCVVRRVSVDFADAAAQAGFVAEIASARRGLVLTEALSLLSDLHMLEHLIDAMPKTFRWWIVDTALPSSPSYRTADPHLHVLISPGAVLDAFESRGWTPIQIRRLRDQAALLDSRRASELERDHVAAELEAIWLFERGSGVESTANLSA